MKELEMDSYQKQVLESFVRVRAFTDAYPVTGRLSFALARSTLDEVVPRLREYAGAQVTGRQLSRAELRRQAQLSQQLVDQHMRPLVTIARAQIEPESDVRLPAAMQMPRSGVGVTRILQASDGMIEAARPFEAALVAHGLPADFLAQFTAARDALEGVLDGRAVHIGTHAGAGKGLQVEMRRGRRAVDRIDAVVRASFANNEVVLATWRAAKRVQRRPGGATTPESEEVADSSPVEESDAQRAA
jgi:hypothetical protein